MHSLFDTLHTWKKRLLCKREWFRKYQLPFGKKVYLLGTPCHGNIGDNAIAIAEICFLEKCGFTRSRIKEITVSEYKKNRERIISNIPSKYLICIHGGGNIGNQWYGEELFRYGLLEDFPKHQMIIFPQTIFFLPDSEREISESINRYNGRERFSMFAREEESYTIMKQLYPDSRVLLSPDIVLSTRMDDYGVEPSNRRGVLFCIRQDAEKIIPNDMWENVFEFVKSMGKEIMVTDMLSECEINKSNRYECVRKKMQELCRAELVITDRLHAMVFSAITETPCVVMSNYNHKVRGTFQWIKHLPYIHFLESMDDIQLHITMLLRMDNCKYDNSPLDSYYNALAEEIKNASN